MKKIIGLLLLTAQLCFAQTYPLKAITVIAVGKQAHSSQLKSDALREREESPRTRKPLSEITL